VRPDGQVVASDGRRTGGGGSDSVELEALLTTRYREFIRDTHVTVAVKEINSKKVYLVGEVKKEGPVRIQAPITVLQALLEAGGVTDYAKPAQDLCFADGRRPPGEAAVRLRCRGARRRSRSRTSALMAGDTIVVPR